MDTELSVSAGSVMGDRFTLDRDYSIPIGILGYDQTDVLCGRL
jgi:hypothetical protein